jgi:rhodanese-related sulfurtransferase
MLALRLARLTVPRPRPFPPARARRAAPPPPRAFAAMAAADAPEKSYAEVDAQGAAALVASGATLLDVRTPEEYAASHAPNAVHVPLKLLEDGKMQLNPGFRAAAQEALKGATGTVVCTCYGGGRGGTAAAELAAAGFTTANLLGGMGGWHAAGLPIEGGDAVVNPKTLSEGH